MSASPPNVLLILADDLGYGDLACFGNPIVRTPHLDALADEGVTLTQHYSASPLCAPARAALLTGRYNHRTGAVDVPSNRGLDRIALDERTIGDVFSAADYATGMVGKWHNGLHDMRHHPNSRGFREFAGFLNGGMDYYRWVLDRNGSPERADGRYLTDVFSSEAVDFIRRHRKEPFFLYLAYNAPHLPYQAPESLLDHYRHNGSLTDSVRLIYAMVEAMDAGFGRAFEELESLGLAENTIVVFTSDNGPILTGDSNRYNGPFRGMKGDALEGGIRVPAIVRWPAGIPGHRNTDGLMHFTDWLPTLASLAGPYVNRVSTGAGIGSHGKPLDGFDMSMLLRKEASDDPAPARQVRYWQRNRYEPIERCNGAMRDGPWKLVWPMLDGADWKDPGDNEFYRAGMTSAHRIMGVDSDLPNRPVSEPNRPELYRLDDDPHEDVDLSAHYPERIGEMTSMWDQWFADVAGDWQSVYRRNVGG